MLNVTIDKKLSKNYQSRYINVSWLFLGQVTKCLMLMVQRSYALFYNTHLTNKFRMIKFGKWMPKGNILDKFRNRWWPSLQGHRGIFINIGCYPENKFSWDDQIWSIYRSILRMCQISLNIMIFFINLYLFSDRIV